MTKRTVLAGIGIALCLLGVTLWRFEGIQLNSIQKVVYCAFPFAVGLLALLLAAVSDEMMVVLLVNSLAVCLVLLGFEYHLQRIDFPRRHTGNSQTDNRQPLEELIYLQRSKPGLVMSFLPSVVVSQNRPVEADGWSGIPLSGVSRRPTLFCNESGNYVSFMSDEDGFNNPRGLWLPDKIAVVAVGDSFTEGACVRAEENMIAVVRRAVPETINLGIAGNGPLLELAVVREYAIHLRPRVILWLYFENDLTSDLKTELGSALMRRYLDPSFEQGLITRQPAINDAIEEYLADSRNEQLGVRAELGKLLTFKRLRILLRLDSILFSSGQPNYSVFRRVLTSARDEARSWNGELIFVFVPSWAAFEDAARQSAKRKELRRRVLLTADQLTLPVIDLQALMAADPAWPHYFYYPGSHFSPAGYKRGGELMVDFLRRIRPDLFAARQ